MSQGIADLERTQTCETSGQLRIQLQRGWNATRSRSQRATVSSVPIFMGGAYVLGWTGTMGAFQTSSVD